MLPPSCHGPSPQPHLSSLNASISEPFRRPSGFVTHLGKVHQGVGLVAQLPLLHLDTPQSVGESCHSQAVRVRAKV